MRKKFLLATLLFGIALAVNVSTTPPSSKKIVAGPVKATGVGITGSFKVVEDSAGIPSAGNGGGSTCKVDSDCTLAPEFTGGVGYCLQSKGILGLFKQGKCWIRPAETQDAPYRRRPRVVPIP